MVSIDMSSHMPSNNSTSIVILIVDNCSSFQDILSLLKPKLLLPYSQNPVFVPFAKTLTLIFKPITFSCYPLYIPQHTPITQGVPNQDIRLNSFNDFTSVSCVLPVMPNSLSLINQTMYSEEEKNYS
jgi:hypothetical protein